MSHKAHPQNVVGGYGTERDQGLSPDREVLAGRRMPPWSAAPGPGPTQESGHVAGDGTEGVEQGGLHAGLQEQQVHMDLGHKQGLVGN